MQDGMIITIPPDSDCQKILSLNFLAVLPLDQGNRNSAKVGLAGGRFVI
jgi:hypothetical protein